MSTATESATITRADVTAKIMAAKVAADMKWEDLAKLTGQNPVWTPLRFQVSVHSTLNKRKPSRKKFELDDFETKLLQVYPYRGCLNETVPTDPFVYRFFEIMQVYGTAMKEVSQEEFGDGIMSAIDFSIDIEREPDPKGDRVKIVYSGKFLPYKQF